jgi:hypothetical protein
LTPELQLSPADEALLGSNLGQIFVEHHEELRDLLLELIELAYPDPEVDDASENSGHGTGAGRRVAIARAPEAQGPLKLRFSCELPLLLALFRLKHCDLEMEELDFWEFLLLWRAGSGNVDQSWVKELVSVIAKIGELPSRSAHLQMFQASALLAVHRLGNRWNVPPGGIEFDCEACGETDRLFRSRRNYALAVDFGPEGNPDSNLDAPDVRKRLEAGRRHILYVVCDACARRKAKRCAHEWLVHLPGDPAAKRGWRRCDTISSGGLYCAVHSTAEVLRERQRQPWRAQRSPDA